MHQHGPCSPLAAEHGNKAPNHEEILTADQHRVESIRRRVHETTGRGRARPKLRPSTIATSDRAWSYSGWSTNLPVSSGSALGAGNYVVTIGLGTPSKRFTVVFDTGSDTTWVQCEPCVVTCYPQQEPLFDPTKSSTYANISCASPYCSDLSASGCSGGHCLYAVQYGDGSITVGFFAQDTLALARDRVNAFRFGCGERNKGLFGRTAGLMGLGRGPTSLTVQTAGRYRGLFAYCLPPRGRARASWASAPACPWGTRGSRRCWWTTGPPSTTWRWRASRWAGGCCPSRRPSSPRPARWWTPAR